MPAALHDPDRQPALRLEVRVRPRAAHERPPDLPRPRQGARRLQQHQRDDLPARQPAGLRALGRRAGHEGVGLPHCLPYFKRMETCLAGADDWRGGDGPLVLERGPAENPLFGAFFQAAQDAGYPLTDDVNGYRQEGFARFDRNLHRGRRLSAARAYLHPVRQPEEPHGPDAGLRHRRPLRGQARGRRRLPARRPAAPPGRRRRGDPLRRRDQHPAAAPALRRRRRRRPAAQLGIDVVARRARGRREPPGPPRGLRPVRLQAAGLDRARAAAAGPPRDRLPVAVPPPRARRHQPLRGRRLRPQQRRRRLPEPDVPLPAGRRSATTAARRPRATATRCTSARCTPTPAAT